ncbi:MAG: hypothetical protein JWO82_2833 [Akkermansiaceae bacterium]|nr:hypothetical protein [Akkermansiaceae bacterium]
MKFPLHIALLAIALSALLPSCGTPAGKVASGVISSPAVQAIVSLAVKAGENALLEKTGQKLSPEAQAALAAAVTPLVDQVTTSTLTGIADALKGKQATADAANSGKLIAAVTSATATPVPIAVNVAEAVPTISNTVPGASPAIANSVVAAAIESVATQRAAQ